MKRSISISIMAILAAALLALYVLGCAKDSGPNRDNQFLTGSLLEVISVTSGDGPASSTWTIDMVRVDCGTPLSPRPEKFYDATYNATLQVLSPSHISGSAKTGIMIESYDVVYSTSEVGQPALAPLVNVAVGYYMNPNSTLTVNSLLLISLDTKSEFLLKGGDPSVFPIYNCKITFHGENDYGEEVTATTSVFVSLGDYDHC